MTILWKLFLSFIQVGLFSVGGGYAAIPLIRAQTVTMNGWLSMEEFTNLVTIAEMTPGPIAVNAATFVGIRLAGIGGAITATMGCILPSLIIVSVLSAVYGRYGKAEGMQTVLGRLRPAVVALIASAALGILRVVLFGSGDILLQNIRWVGLILFIAALLVLRIKKWNPILVMLSCGGLNLLFQYLSGGL